MSRVALKSLLESFSAQAASPLDEEAPVASFTTRPAAQPGYVWPDVEVPDGPMKPVILIRSSGAMGKTCAARAIAHQLRAPLVDLSQTRVGADSLTGLLARALGWAGAAEFTTQLRCGSRALVLDGLDEAQLLVGRESYIAFLANVLDLVDTAGPGAQVIAFGRHDAIETAELALLERGETASVVPLLPLSATQARLLIDETLDLDADCNVHRQHREPWERLRDRYLDDIGRALLGRAPSLDGTDWGLIDDFLGYAPVVLAIAESLNVVNPEKEVAKLQGTSASDIRLDRGRLLKGIVETIVARESTKVGAHLGHALELDEQLWPLVYTADEQVVRVIAATTAQALIAAPPQSIPSNKKTVYEELITPWVLDHPFLRERRFANVVFRDYVRAFVSTAPLAEVFGLRRIELIGACGPVGPFYAHFVHAMTATTTPQDEDFSYGTASEDLVDDLIRSNALGVDMTPYAVYLHRDGHAHLTLGQRDSQRPAFGFHIDKPDGVLTLRSPVSRIIVDSDSAVILDVSEGRVELGPEVLIFAAELEIVGPRMAAYPGREEDELGVVLLAQDAASHEPDLAIKSHGESSLVISWPDPMYQWRPYQVPDTSLGVPAMTPYRAQRLMHSLRRLLTGFRAGDEPWMYYERYDNLVVGPNPLLRAGRDALLQNRVLARHGERYVLNLERLGEFGVNYAALKTADWQACLQQLALDVLKNKAVGKALGLT